MFRHVAPRIVLVGWLLVVACDADRDDNTARVTIDVRCGSNADCPTGFSCDVDAEHGAPTSMCQSIDPEASCPRGYETHVGYGQTFCKLRLSVESRTAGSSTAIGHGRSSHR
jgi:hypothetical protein